MYALIFCELYALIEYCGLLIRTQCNLCAQYIFQVHSTQTNEPINSVLVYVPMFRRYGTHHIIWGEGG